eukprot:gene26911-4528_t
MDTASDTVPCEDETALLEEESENMMSSSQASAAHPVSICAGSHLWRILDSDQKYVPFMASTFTTVSSEQFSGGGVHVPRFIATYELFTCVAVFAHSITADGSSWTAFGAHIDAECFQGAKSLPSLTEALKCSFSGKDIAKQVKAYLVGGHRKDDSVLKGQPGALYNAVRNAVKRAGVKDIDQSLGLRFEGQHIGASDYEQNMAKLYATNQLFCIAALDVVTGKMVTHTDASVAFPLQASLGPRNAENAKLLLQTLGSGHALVRACALCGIRKSKDCSRCKRTSYCSAERQRTHWRQAHKSNCHAPAL